MQILQTTLLTGPYDWDPKLLPKSEFEARLSRVRAALDAAGAEAVLVHGHPGDYGALAYLTNFVPKLGLALALVPRDGSIVLVVSGTALMLTQAKRLTWIEDVRSVGSVPKLVSSWAAEHGVKKLALWGAGAMAHGLHGGIENALRPAVALVPADAPLDAIRRRKSPVELGLMREGSRILARMTAVFTEAARGGKGVRSAGLAAEHEAIRLGAQDARTLASAHPGGMPLPIDGAEDRALDPLLAALAVRHAGYWAEALVTIATRPGDAEARATAALSAMLRLARAGTTAAALQRAAADALAPLQPHPYLRGAAGSAIGLSLEEASLSGDAALDDGATYVLRAGAGDALASAMIAVTSNGAEILGGGA
jgi:Xaa-Pro dipeptidase